MSYSREDIRAITTKVIDMAAADTVQVEFSGGERSAIRYANSTITANLVELDRELQITVHLGSKSATTSTHRFDDGSLRAAVDQAQALARHKPDNPESVPLVQAPQAYLPVEAALPSIVDFGPAERARNDRFWARKQGREPTPATPTQSLVMSGGTATLGDMIGATKRGLLVTSFWYIRAVDPMDVLHTGMTRDGLFLIEDGQVVAPVQNFRWNETPAVGFNNISMLGRSIPMHTGESYDDQGTALVPPMRIEAFTMTSVSPAV